MTDITIEQLYQQHIKAIPVTEQLRLIALIGEQLALKTAQIEKQPSLLELEGLGSHIWEGIDAQEYVDKLRQEWEDNQ
jgi:hypothetical protein